MRYLSLCSGIEAVTVAWNNLPFEPVAFAEIEKFPCAVLNHHYPNVPNLGDMTKINGEQYRGAIDLIVGGTPCQDFSVAGSRAGLSGERSGLAMQFVRLVQEIKPLWLLWENVPGAFSTNDGRDFGTFIKALDQCGYHLAWRVLDAQNFGVPQRRRRIFLVGHSGDWRCAAKVLFEPTSLQGDRPESRQEMQKTSERRGCPHQGWCYENHSQDGRLIRKSISPTITARWGTGGINQALVAKTLLAKYGSNDPWTETFPYGEQGIRRLTPLECERLQGFPDSYTQISWRGKPAEECPDSHRYKALGNSMAVPVVRWIGERISDTQKR